MSSRARNMASNTTAAPTVYFGFGSNLWLHQMSIRCPTSTYIGVARLSNYKWIINDRGYANVVETPSSSSSDYSHVVFGLVYTLQPKDESRLDVNEGVPYAYTKELLTCDFWESEDGEKIDVARAPTATKKMLVYIDRKRITESKPHEEYVYRINKGIDDAVKMGVPRGYVKQVVRKFITEETEEVGRRKSTEAKARKQAVQFVDENEG